MRNMMSLGAKSNSVPSFNIMINQTQAGSCDLAVANPCTATSTHQAVPSLETGVVNYVWSVYTTGTSNPQIISGQGTDTVEVSDSKGSLGEDTLDSIAPSVIVKAELVTFTSTVDNDFNLAVTTVGTAVDSPVVKTLSVESGQGRTYVLSFDVVVNSGTCVLDDLFVYLENPSDFVKDTLLATGHYEYTCDVVGTALNAQMYFDGTSLFDISVTNWTVKQVDAVDPDSSFILVCEATDDVATTSKAVRVVHDR